MSGHRWFFFLLMLLLFIGGGFLRIQGAYAQEAVPDVQPIDVVIVLDDSSSMATCWPRGDNEPLRTTNCPRSDPSDPALLRYSAARLLVYLADDTDRLAVIRFDSKWEPVGSGQLQPVGGADSRQALVESLQPPSNYQGRGWTRMDLGIQRAAELLLARSEPTRPGYILFLTDGTPTQPDSVADQDDAIRLTMSRLTAQGIRLFPVVLCNRGECPSQQLGEMMGDVAEARTAEDLLQAFSQIFTVMKPTLHIVEHRNPDGKVEFFTRVAHGTQQLLVVTPQDSFRSLRRDGAVEPTLAMFEDANIELNSKEGGTLPEGKWTVEAQGGQGAFVVARTATYPEIVHPPAAPPGGIVAPHVVPQGKPVLIVATIRGPAGQEPLFLEGNQPLQPLTPDGTLRWMVVSTPEQLSLQVGADTQPLRIIRQFRFQPQANLPLAQAPTPTCVANQPCSLVVEFPPGPEVESLQGQLYISEVLDGEKAFDFRPMVCQGRRCEDSSFIPVEGHLYHIRFTVQARSGGTWFGDWAETSVAMKPAIYLRGLPDPLDPRQQPEAGWPVTVVAGTTQDLGYLRATLTLTRLEDGAAPTPVSVLFGVDIRTSGEQQTALRLTGIETLPPGHYQGEIRFGVDNPPVNQDIQLPTPLQVDFTIGKPLASVQETTADFGTILFDPSPNFRLDARLPLTLRFSEQPFPLSATLEQSTCPDLTLLVESPQPTTEGYHQVMVRLQSSRPVLPQTCIGAFRLQGPSDKYEVGPTPLLAWQIVIPQIEWGLVGSERESAVASDIEFGDFGEVGERGHAFLLVRYTGRPPFTLVASRLNGMDDRAHWAINERHVSFVTGSAEAVAGQEGVYRVPVELVAQQPVAHHWLWGSRYTGELALSIANLPDSQPQPLRFAFRSPSWGQRHIEPPIRRFYHLPFPGLVSFPLSILALFAVMALRNTRAAERYQQEQAARTQAEIAHRRAEEGQNREQAEEERQKKPLRPTRPPQGANARPPGRPPSGKPTTNTRPTKATRPPGSSPISPQSKPSTTAVRPRPGTQRPSGPNVRRPPTSGRPRIR